MTGSLMQLWTEETGQGMTEYSLIIALVAIVLITALVLYGERISNLMSYAAGKVTF